MTLNYKCNQIQKTIELGNAFYSVPHEIYRDAPADLISSLVEKVKKGENWKALIKQEVEPRNQWLSKIILEEKRNDFLKLIPEYREDFLALDIGAGWGQHTIEISKKGKVCGIEPSPERFEFMKAICTQENTIGNCFLLNTSMDFLEFDPVFDFAISIGVLEWVGKFEKCDIPKNVQLKFLKTIKKALKQNSPLLVGIENRIGLKYLLGGRDDHIGLPYIACREYEDANLAWNELGNGSLKVVTYDLKEYIKLFRQAGFSSIEVYAALPDYKIPKQIIPCYPDDKFSAFLEKGEFIDEHEGNDGVNFKNNDVLKSIYKTFARLGIAPYFAPSYFIVAR